MQQEHKDEKIVDDKMPVFKDPFHKLCQYWDVTDADNPTFRDIYDHQEKAFIIIPELFL